MQEGKHGIFRDYLGFRDFKNFDGVRFTYKGVRIVDFKNANQVLTSRQTTFKIMKSNSRKLGLNSLTNFYFLLFFYKKPIPEYYIVH